MDAQAFLDALRARGVILEARGNRLRYRPREAVSPEERHALATCKRDLLLLLGGAPPTSGGREVPGVANGDTEPVSVAAEREAGLDPELAAALAKLDWEIATGEIAATPLLVRGQPLGHVLPLEEVARWLRRGRHRR